MLSDTPGEEPTTETPAEPVATPDAADTIPAAAPAKKAAAKRAPAKKTAAKKTTARKTAAKKTATPPPADAPDEPAAETSAEQAEAPAAPARPAKKAAARRTTKKAAAKPAAEVPAESTEAAASPEAAAEDGSTAAGTALIFQAPDAAQAPPARRSRAKKKPAEPVADEAPATDESDAPAAAAEGEGAPVATEPVETEATDEEPDQDAAGDGGSSEGGESAGRRRRRRGGRRRRKPGGEPGEGNEAGPDDDAGSSDKSGDRDSGRGGSKDTTSSKDDDSSTDAQGDDDGKDAEGGDSPSSRRRRRRRRAGEDGGDGGDDPRNTVTRVRQTRTAEDQITSLSGSTRLEAKKQRRREGREAGRRRAPIVSEAEFLARRESVDRVMAIRQRDDLTQIAVLEDKVLVEHYVARESQTSLIGNVYLGRVQNVLPSMEAAFIDIGKGRNAVLYAGEVNWSALGHKEGQPRKIESVLSSGQSVLVQVTKDPVGHKGARLTSQVSLAGRFLVYVPDGTNSGISRKLPDTERNRLKTLLKEIVPDGAGVIVRTAAEGASEEELTRDVERLTARWADIEKAAKGSAPQLLYGEPDLTLKVVRDLFTEDFSKLAIQGEEAWETVQTYVGQVAPDLQERVSKHDGDGTDLFAAYRIDEQIAKGLDRKVWLPSGGSLIIDRTEAMTVVDVNTGKFTGSGGNLEETVTKNNLEAAEEIVRQLRLRDIGGIIVIDFIDMVLESNRDLVLRRLVECLGRDRTRHQVAEVTSLGLVQMTRKRIGTGLLEAFSETCTHCNGRGLITTEVPVEPRRSEEEPRRSRRSRGGRSGRGDGDDNGKQESSSRKGPSPKDVAAMARASEAKPEDEPADQQPTDVPEAPAVAQERAEQTEPAEPTQAPKRERARRSGKTTNAEPVEEQATATEPEASPAEPTATEGDAPSEPTPAPAPEPTAEPTAEPAPPSTPTVVTRTRRRSASRPAGPPSSASTPPAAAGSVGAPPVDGIVEPGTADAEPATTPTVEHVPVKKRGSRKR
ncbi:Rne/Rng family ribonuclease [Nocardioides euryhalodurans]|uniref:Ribonuclease E n=1 Tax=Nocardioides euryhalodurans TaxID=2518370 RepID=A0A4P7GPA4_9ACTN|nr:Rne/Rng family ribonuclease [Nocardioides euryhalodurans]QBR93950.1 Rne/Rng family ribonuclease [Nocardioides euryhalodurans]